MTSLISSRTRQLALLVVAGALALSSPTAPVLAQDKPAGTEWQPLFDGKTLGNWQPTKFIGQGVVTVEDGRIVLAAGRDMTGITWAGPALPTRDYELALEAMRLEGSDFFAGITFPVGDSHCS